MRKFSACAVIIGWLMFGGCAENRPDHTPKKRRAADFRKLEVAGIQNFYWLDEGLYSGAAPEGDAGFETLKKAGVRTIISVDGLTPEVELAAKYGLKYVHVPVGYDGVTRSNALVIIKAAETMPGPIFIHCHHGLHRGPAAAAIVCEGLRGWTPEQAENWLRTAGTATNYAGLYRTVRGFIPPSDEELRRVPKNFPSRAKTPDLVQTMVKVDEHFDILKALQKSDFHPLPNYPDATSENESLILYELFREAHRANQGAGQGETFLTELGRVEATAGVLHNRLQELQRKPEAGLSGANQAFQQMTETCTSCHEAYRN